MKRSTLKILALSALLTLGAANIGAAADAPTPPAMPGMAHGGHGAGPKGGRGMMAQLSPEKQDAVRKIQDEYRDKIFPLRQDLFTKRAELNAAMAQANPDLNKAKALNKEINDIETKIGDLSLEARARITKETGIRGGMGMGMGGMGGMGGGCPMMGGGMGGGMGMGGGHGGMMGGHGMMGGAGDEAPAPAPAQ